MKKKKETKGQLMIRELVESTPVQRREVAMAPACDRMRMIEDQILEQTMSIVRDSLRFADIDPASKEVPPQWIDEVGQEGAVVRYRVAQAAWMSPKEAPVGLRIAKEVMVGIIRARATEDKGPRELNMTVVKMQVNIPSFPELEVDR